MRPEQMSLIKAQRPDTSSSGKVGLKVVYTSKDGVEINRKELEFIDCIRETIPSLDEVAEAKSTKEME